MLKQKKKMQPLVPIYISQELFKTGAKVMNKTKTFQHLEELKKSLVPAEVGHDPHFYLTVVYAH